MRTTCRSIIWSKSPVKFWKSASRTLGGRLVSISEGGSSSSTAGVGVAAAVEGVAVAGDVPEDDSFPHAAPPKAKAATRTGRNAVRSLFVILGNTSGALRTYGTEIRTLPEYTGTLPQVWVADDFVWTRHVIVCLTLDAVPTRGAEMPENSRSGDPAIGSALAYVLS